MTNQKDLSYNLTQLFSFSIFFSSLSDHSFLVVTILFFVFVFLGLPQVNGSFLQKTVCRNANKRRSEKVCAFLPRRLISHVFKSSDTLLGLVAQTLLVVLTTL